MVEVLPCLVVESAEKSESPVAPRRLDEPEGQVRGLLCASVDEKLSLAGEGALGHQIDDAAERGGTIERRGRPLDDLDLAEVERRYLEQTERIALKAVQWQPIRKEL